MENPGVRHQTVAGGIDDQRGGQLHLGTINCLRLLEFDMVILERLPRHQRHPESRVPADRKGHGIPARVLHDVGRGQRGSIQRMPDAENEIIGISQAALLGGRQAIGHRRIRGRFGFIRRLAGQAMLRQANLPFGTGGPAAPQGADEGKQMG